MSKKQSINQQCEVFWDNVEYLKGVKNCTDSDIARAMGRTPQTVYNRRYHPRTTTLDDVFKLGRYFDINPASLLVPLAPANIPSVKEEISE